jgi:sec-independent protein translocase protein TatA
MFGIGPPEMLILLVIGVLLFGKNLPTVGRQLGKSMMEFKKGLSDIQNEVNAAVQAEPSRPAHRRVAEDFDEPTAPKFEPPTQEPTSSTA